MALIIGVAKKDKFYINHVPVLVLNIEGQEMITLKVNPDTPNSKTFNITDMQSEEIYPQVFVSSGVHKSKGHDKAPRLVIEAPREVSILREELYNAKYYK